MAAIKEAVAEDFETVYPLLHDFSPRTPKKDWKRLFTKHWAHGEDTFGYLLLDNEKKVEGFLGLIFSKRTIRGREHNFCNMTSWIVQEGSRTGGLLLMARAMKLKGVTLTNFSTTEPANNILKKFGFQTLETHLRLLLPVPSPGSLLRKSRVIAKGGKILPLLDDTNRQVFEDHQGFGCHHLLIRTDDGDCYVVAKKVFRKSVPFARIHYVSNRSVFAEHIRSIRWKLCLRLRVAGLLVDERCMEGVDLRSSARIEIPLAHLYKSDTLKKEDIDSLYSELIILPFGTPGA